MGSDKKTTCTVIEDGYRLGTFDLGSSGIVLRSICKSRFSHDPAHIKEIAKPGFDTKGSPGVRDSYFASPDSKVLQVGSPADSLNLEVKKSSIKKTMQLVESLEKIVFPMRFTDKLNSVYNLNGLLVQLYLV